MPKVEEMATDFVLGTFGKNGEGSFASMQGMSSGALGAEDSRTAVLFVGSQLDVADLRSRADAVQNLGTVLSGAVSSLVVPYTTSQGASIREAVCSKLDQAGVQHEVVGCDSPVTDLKASLAAVLAKGGARAVIVCSQLDAALDNTNAGLAAEMEQLATVQAAVEAAGGSHVVLYTSQPSAIQLVAAENGKRRSLLQAASFTGFGNYTSCGVLCQTQVRWLEGMLAAIVLALASCAGLVCLYVLDTPTRFETPKDVASQQS